MFIKGLFENIPEGTKALFFVLAHEEAIRTVVLRVLNLHKLYSQDNSVYLATNDEAEAAHFFSMEQ